MSTRSLTAIAATVAAVLLGTLPAHAAVVFDAGTGTGFVGKGDVQLALGWNNKQLQENAGTVAFSTRSSSSTTTTWECTSTDGETVRQLRNGSSSSGQAVVSTVARERAQVTGFVLDGYGEGWSLGNAGGPDTDTCPEGFTLSTPAGPPVVTSSFELLVNGVPLP